MELKVKNNPIVNDYVISDTVLGKGADGNVILVTEKITNNQYALKVLCL